VKKKEERENSIPNKAKFLYSHVISYLISEPLGRRGISVGSVHLQKLTRFGGED
jgi:hypothetical protein